jgi:hypothetical protein
MTPTLAPTVSPTSSPTWSPTQSPTPAPTNSPTTAAPVIQYPVSFANRLNWIQVAFVQTNVLDDQTTEITVSLTMLTCNTRSSTLVVQIYTEGTPNSDVFAFEIGIMGTTQATQVLDFTSSVSLSPKFNTFRVYLVDTFSYNANIDNTLDVSLANALASAEYVQDLTSEANQITSTDNAIKFNAISFSGNRSANVYLSASLECYYGSRFVMPMFQLVNSSSGNMIGWTSTSLTQQCPTVETDKATLAGVLTSNYSNERVEYSAYLVGGESSSTIQSSIPYLVTDSAVHAFSTVRRPSNTTYESISNLQASASICTTDTDYKFNYSVDVYLTSDGYSNVSLIISVSSSAGTLIGRRQVILGPIPQTPTEYQASYLTSSTPYPSNSIVNLSLVDTMLYAKSSTTALSKAYTSYSISIKSPAKPSTSSSGGSSSSSALLLTGSDIALIIVCSLIGGAAVGFFVRFRMKKAAGGTNKPAHKYSIDDSEKEEKLVNMQGETIEFENLERQKQKSKLQGYLNFQLS